MSVRLKRNTLKDPKMLCELGQFSEKDNNFYQAKKYYHKALNLDHACIQAVYGLALIYQKEEDYQQAVLYLKKAAELLPDIAQIHNSLGLAYRKIGAYDYSLASFRKALSIDPMLAEVYNNMGVVFNEIGNYSNALKCYMKSVEVDPSYANAYYNAGNIAFKNGDLNTAVNYYQRATIIKNDYTKAYNNLGCVLQYQGKYAQALTCFKKALGTDPDNLSTLYNLSSVYRFNGQLREAMVYIHKILTLKPDDYLASVFYYEQLRDICDWKKLGPLSRRLDHCTNTALYEKKKPEETPFLNITRSDDMDKNLAVAKLWSDDITKTVLRKEILPNRPASKKKSGKIKIGYLSDGFKRHPATILIHDIFRYHDREKFNITCYSYGENDQNEYRKNIEMKCDRFLDVQDFDDVAIANRIHSDECDIIVDIKGHTLGNRMKIFAYRPAPIQVRFLGMPGTTGASFFDYLLTDRIVTPKTFSRFYTEKFAYLPDCYQVNSVPLEMDATLSSHSDEGLPLEKFIFCCFCVSYKIDADIFRTWMSILHRVPESLLWLLEKDEEFKRNILSEAGLHGISQDRIIFAKRRKHEAHLRRLKLAHLALDTTKVSGAATTSDALWAGVPILTLEGKHFSSRMSASILHSVRLDGLITHSFKEYENKAVYLAENLEELNALKKLIQRDVLCETLFNTKEYVGKLEMIYQEMWNKFINGKPASVIDLWPEDS